MADGRSQLVWVASNTARLDQLEIRDVRSMASRGKGTPPAAATLPEVIEVVMLSADRIDKDLSGKAE